MPNPVPAAAEGLPEINRRNALAVTGAGLVAALSGMAASIAATSDKTSDIETLFWRWMEVANASTSHIRTEADGEAYYRQYRTLQEAIIALMPVTARDLAMQLYADGDQGDSENSVPMTNRLKQLAVGDLT